MIEDRASSLRQRFLALEELLRREGDNEWLRKVSEIVRALEPPFASEEQCIDTIQEAKHRFESWHKHKGGFSEFYVHRENYEERLAANKELDAIREAILENT